MIIIFEGADGVGKTTLAKELNLRLANSMYMKRTPTFKYKDANTFYHCVVDLTRSSEYDWRFMLDMISKPCEEFNFIFDRSFITQAVYQNAIGQWTKHPTLTSILSSYHAHLASLPHIVFNIKRSNFIKTDDSYDLVHDKQHLIVNEYDKWVEYEDTKQLFVVTLDTSILSEEECMTHILQHIANYNNK
jgi:thymidylate kinase